MAFGKFAAAALVGATLFAAAPASAKVYDFSFQGSTYTASGTFTTGAADADADGGFNIDTLSGTLVSSNSSLLQGAFTITGGNAAGALYTEALTSPDQLFTYNNIYVPGENFFSGAGSFSDGAGANGNFELNFYNGGSANYGSCTADCASVVVDQGNYNPGDIGTMVITAVPEPATWTMLLLGFGALGWTLRSRRNAIVAA